MRWGVLLLFIIKNHYQMNQPNDRIKKTRKSSIGWKKSSKSFVV